MYRDREIHPSVKDLQSTTRLAESWKLQIFDTRVDFPVPVQSRGWLFFSYRSQSSQQNPTFFFQKLLQNAFCLENGANLG